MSTETVEGIVREEMDVIGVGVINSHRLSHYVMDRLGLKGPSKLLEVRERVEELIREEGSYDTLLTDDDIEPTSISEASQHLRNLERSTLICLSERYGQQIDVDEVLAAIGQYFLHHTLTEADINYVKGILEKVVARDEHEPSKVETRLALMDYEGC